MIKESYVKIVLSAVAIIFFVIVGIFVMNKAKSKEAGEIFFIVYDLDDTKIIDRKISFEKNKTLLEVLLEANVDLEYSGIKENAYITKINGKETFITIENGDSYFWELAINDVPAQQGIAQLPFKDGDKITFKFVLSVW